MGKLYLNGALTDAATARIDPSDRGLLLGDGVFETVAVKAGAPRRWPRHAARLRDGAGVIGLNIALSDDALAQAVADVVAANDLTEATVRITVTRGPGPRGIVAPKSPTPTVLITAAPLVINDDPISVIVATRTRRNEFSPLARIKNLNYLDNIIARSEAAEAGADDAIVLNTQGRVAETTVANIFALIGGVLATPPISDGALPGVMRAEVIALARGQEQSLTVEILKSASEVFVTNALGIRAVTAIDGAAVGDGQQGLITLMLASRV